MRQHNSQKSNFFAMGLAPSLMGFPGSFMGIGTGMPSTPSMDVVMRTLFSKFWNPSITTFEEFHVIVLDTFNTFNSALPGKHYDVPPRTDVKEFYEQWKEEGNDANRKEMLIEFMKKNVGLSRLDDYTLMTGLVAPPVAMAAKKAGESIPQLKIIKAVPDVVFVPTATIIALITAKLSREVFVKNPES